MYIGRVCKKISFQKDEQKLPVTSFPAKETGTLHLAQANKRRRGDGCYLYSFRHINKLTDSIV